ncbi:MAG TPA: MCE family protein [Acidimicrobiales bacterium]|nr:MCE family protein [Acidimicrobiales bacterium]
MRRFRERSRLRTGATGIAVTFALLAGALEFGHLPLIHSNSSYTAFFANAGGLSSGDIVTVDGVKVGTITGMSLAGNEVKVTFEVKSDLPLGAETTASAKVLSPVGTEYLELSPAGPGSLSGSIPVSRTTVPYNLVADLAGLGSVIQHYNIPELEKALEVGSQDLNGTSRADVSAAFNGLARISTVVGNEQAALAAIVTQGSGLTSVLSDRSRQLFDLFGQADLVLRVVEQRSADIHQLLASTSNLSQDISHILSVNRPQLTSLLQSLQAVSAILAKDAGDFGKAIPVLAAFARYAANTTGSGAFADVSVPTLLLPDNLIDECASSKSYPSNNPLVGCRP